MRKLLACLAFATTTALADINSLSVGTFSAQNLDAWEEHSFEGNTRYELARVDGRPAVRAQSSAAASGLFRNIRVDLEETPFLSWSWRIDNTINSANEQQRNGDDYPARIYVVRKGGLLPWNTMAVNYVWASNQPAGSSWSNPYTDRARMIALRSGNSESGQWLREKRNVKADFQRLFGEDVRYIDVVALMTDTDNTGENVTAYYGDISFSAH